MTKLLRLNQKVIIKPAYIQSVIVIEAPFSESDLRSWALLICLPDNNRIKIWARDEDTAVTMFQTLWTVLNGERNLTSKEYDHGLFWKESEEKCDCDLLNFDKVATRKFLLATMNTKDTALSAKEQDVLIENVLSEIMEMRLKKHASIQRNK